MSAALLALYEALNRRIDDFERLSIGPTGPKGDKGEKGDKGDKGDTGPSGRDGTNGKDGVNGKDGIDGRNGTDGRNGVDGKDGKDGVDGTDGKDGLSVVDARLDFDNSLVITLSDGSEIDAGTINVATQGDVYYNVSMGGGSGGVFSGKGFTAPYEAATALSENTLVYLDTDGNMAPASCTALETVSSMLAVSVGSVLSGERGTFLLQGFAPVSGFVAGDVLYVSEDNGVITNVRPENNGFFVRIVGYAISNSEIYFDPDKTWIELEA
jgi:hypothetical protein